MKKILIVPVVLITILLTSGMASAHWRTYFNFGVYLPPLAVWTPPPPPVAAYPGYPSNGYHSPGYYGYRVWVPGYWESRWTAYGWRRAWIPGYWRYTP